MGFKVIVNRYFKTQNIKGNVKDGFAEDCVCSNLIRRIS